MEEEQSTVDISAKNKGMDVSKKAINGKDNSQNKVLLTLHINETTRVKTIHVITLDRAEWRIPVENPKKIALANQT